MTIKANMFRLNLGCGPHYAEGWLNLDRYDDDLVPDGRKIDLKAEAGEIPLEDGCCSQVYMGHLIEHLDPGWQVDQVLQEAKRVLCKDGELMVVGPDIEKAEAGWPEMCDAIRPRPGPDALLPPGIPHLWMPTEDDVASACIRYFKTVRALPAESVSARWPIVDRVGWQFAVECVK